MEPVLAQFGRAFEAVPAALLVVDDGGRIVLANADVNELFGYEAGELIGQPIEVLVPPEARDGHPELREAYQSLPHRRTMGSGRDLFGISKSGRMIPVEIGLNAVHSREGDYSVASVLDMSANHAERERTRKAIDATGSGMIMVDRAGRVVLTNDAASEMFNVGQDELLGVAIEQLIPKRFHRRHVVYRTSYSAEPSDRKMGAGRDLYGIRPDGTEFPVEIGLTPIDHESERMIMATVLDISERVRFEEEILRKNDDLSRLNDDLTQFAYSASHDLKAPLTTLEGLLTLISEDIAGGDVKEAAVNADRAKLLSKRLADLIESTLGLAQSEEYGAAEMEAVAVSDLIEHTRQSLDGLFEAHDVEMRNRVSVECTPLTQRTRLRQIIENLVSNAVKYSDPDKPERHVEVSANLTSDTILIVVQDNGVGIPEEAAEHVFKRFRRFGSHDVEGTGVGLALVKQHVDRMEGQITFTSSPEGTRFELTLPLSQTGEMEATSAVPDDARSIGQPEALS